LADRLDSLGPGFAVSPDDAPLARELVRLYTVARYGEAMVRDLSTLITFHTVSAGEDRPPGTGSAFAEQRNFLTRRATELGFRFDSIDGRVEEITLPGLHPGAPVVGVLTHGDVVSVDGQEWSLPPWDGRVVEASGEIRVVGRGAEDDKGPIVATLYSMAALADTGWPRPTALRLLVTNGEETDWSDVEHYLERRPAPDVTLGIDASYPVTHAQKGYGVVEVVARPRPATIEEEDIEAIGAGDGAGGEARSAETARPPAPAWRLLEISGGSGLSIIPGQGSARLAPLGGGARAALLERQARDWAATHPPARLTVTPGADGEVTIAAFGRGGHSSVPESGHNALGDLTDFLAELYDAGELARDSWGDLAAFLGRTVATDTDGSGLGIDHRDPEMGALTVSLALFDRASDGSPRARLNTRVPRGIPNEEMNAQLLARTNLFGRETGARIDAVSDLQSAPHLVPASGPLVSTLLDTWREVTGETARPVAIGGSTQARLFPGGVDFGPGSPTGGYRGHGPDEYLTVGELGRITELTVTALARLGKIADDGSDITIPPEVPDTSQN
jgi:dipeptidase D